MFYNCMGSLVMPLNEICSVTVVFCFNLSHVFELPYACLNGLLLLRYKWYVPLTYVMSSSPRMKSPVVWMKKSGGLFKFV